MTIDDTAKLCAELQSLVDEVDAILNENSRSISSITDSLVHLELSVAEEFSQELDSSEFMDIQRSHKENEPPESAVQEATNSEPVLQQSPELPRQVIRVDDSPEKEIQQDDVPPIREEPLIAYVPPVSQAEFEHVQKTPVLIPESSGHRRSHAFQYPKDKEGNLGTYDPATRFTDPTVRSILYHHDQWLTANHNRLNMMKGIDAVYDRRMFHVETHCYNFAQKLPLMDSVAREVSDIKETVTGLVDIVKCLVRKLEDPTTPALLQSAPIPLKPILSFPVDDNLAANSPAPVDIQDDSQLFPLLSTLAADKSVHTAIQFGSPYSEPMDMDNSPKHAPGKEPAIPGRRERKSKIRRPASTTLVIRTPPDTSDYSSSSGESDDEAPELPPAKLGDGSGPSCAVILPDVPPQYILIDYQRRLDDYYLHDDYNSIVEALRKKFDSIPAAFTDLFRDGSRNKLVKLWRNLLAVGWKSGPQLTLPRDSAGGYIPPDDLAYPRPFADLLYAFWTLFVGWIFGDHFGVYQATQQGAGTEDRRCHKQAAAVGYKSINRRCNPSGFDVGPEDSDDYSSDGDDEPRDTGTDHSPVHPSKAVSNSRKGSSRSKRKRSPTPDPDPSHSSHHSDSDNNSSDGNSDDNSDGNSDGNSDDNSDDNSEDSDSSNDDNSKKKSSKKRKNRKSSKKKKSSKRHKRSRKQKSNHTPATSSDSDESIRHARYSAIPAHLSKVAHRDKFRLEAIRKALGTPPKFNHASDRDVHQWLTTMQNWLTMGAFPRDDWVIVACGYLTGATADAWRVFLLTHKHIPKWKSFKEFLISTSGQNMAPEKARETLSKVRHTGTVAEFILKFQQLYAKLPEHLRPDTNTSIMILRDGMQPWLYDRFFPKKGGGRYKSLSKFIRLVMREGQECELLAVNRPQNHSGPAGGRGGEWQKISGKRQKRNRQRSPPPKKAHNDSMAVQDDSKSLPQNQQDWLDATRRCRRCGDNRHPTKLCKTGKHSKDKRAAIIRDWMPPDYKKGDPVSKRKSDSHKKDQKKFKKPEN